MFYELEKQSECNAQLITFSICLCESESLRFDRLKSISSQFFQGIPLQLNSHKQQLLTTSSKLRHS